MATYDPVSTATALAESYIYARQQQLDNDEQATQSKVTAVSSLKSALSSFTTALNSLSSKGGVVQQTTSVSNASAVTASASSTASSGSYQFHVRSLATAQQTLYSPTELGMELSVETRSTETSDTGSEDATVKVPTVPVQSRFAISLSNGSFVAIDLSGADQDNDGRISVSEMARAINAASDAKVSASVVTQNGAQHLMLSSSETGLDGGFSLVLANSGSAEDSPSEQSTITGRVMSEAKNASFILGEALLNADGSLQLDSNNQPNSLVIEQASNTYSGIDGLSVIFKAVTNEPLTVNVAKDESTTKANMLSFVDAYNTLTKAIDKLTASGNAEEGIAAGALSSDSGVRSLRNQLNSLLRSTIDGESLTAFGISAQRDGTIKLDETRFAKKVAADPEAIDKLLGKTSTLEYQRTGLLGKLQTYVNSWTNSSGGLLQSRQDNLQKLQKQYTREQSAIDRMYEQAYQRYLTQFTTLASLEDQMSSTSTMLISLLTSSSD